MLFILTETTSLQGQEFPENRRFLILVRAFIVTWMSSCVFFVYFLERMERQQQQNMSHVAIHAHALEMNKRKCTENITFNGTLKDNLQKLHRNKFPLSQTWIKSLGFDNKPARVSTSFPVLVTASSSPFFIRSQGLVKSILDKVLKYNKDIKLIYYNLGLKQEEIDLMNRNCRSCEIREFPFHQFPAHVRKLRTYAFKPIIVNMLYQEFGNVWWLDSSARFITDDFQLPLKYLRENGILFFTYDKIFNVALHTDRKMFTFFSEDPCLYKEFGEIEGSSIVFRKSHVAEVVLRQWVSCALDVDCIAPINATKHCRKPDVSKMDDLLIGSCHRYDQSAISIILRRLYHKRNDYPIVDVPFKITTINRRNDIPFFI